MDSWTIYKLQADVLHLSYEVRLFVSLEIELWSSVLLQAAAPDSSLTLL